MKEKIYGGAADRQVDDQIRVAQERLNGLLDQVDQLPTDERRVAQGAVETLSETLEELHVAQEELRQQNAQLTSARRLLEAERRKYRELFSLAPDGYLVTDAQGVIEEANRAAAALLGVEEDHLVGKPMVVYLPEEEQSEFYARLTSPGCGAALSRTSWETRIRPRSGSPFCAAVTCAPVLDDQGERVGVRWMVRDITGQREAVERNEFQARLLDAIGEAVIATEPDGTVIYANDAAGRLYRWSEEDPAGSAILDVTAVQGFRERAEEILEVLNAGDIWSGEFELERPNGSMLRTLGTATPVLDEDGELTTVISVSRDVTERREAEASLRERTAQLEALQHIAMAITAELDLDDLLNEIMEQGCRLLDAQAGDLFLYDRTTGELEYVLGQGYRSSHVGERLRPGEGLAGRVFERGEPMSVNGYAEWGGRAAAWEEEPVSGALSVPLRRGETIIGTLGFAALDGPRHFGEDDVWLASLFADHAALAIQNARLYDETRRRVKELGILYDVTSAATGAVHLDEVLDRTVQALQSTMGPDAVALLLVEEETDDLVIRASAGFPDGPERVRRSLGAGIPGVVAQTGEPIVLGRAQEDDRYHACDPDTRSELCVPLRSGERVIGALNIESHREDAYDEEDVRLLSILAGGLATMIENARLYEHAKAEIAERRRAERSVRQHLTRLSTLIESLQMGVLFEDSDRCVLHVNEAFCQLFGIDEPEVMIGADCAHAAEASKGLFEDPGGFVQRIDNLLERREALTGEELLLEDGRVFERDYVPIAWDDEQRGTLWLYRDVTEERQMTEQLRQQERLAAVGQLAAGIAHDFRNVLATILLYAEMDLKKPNLPSSIADDLHTVMAEAHRATDLVQQLLDFSSRSMIEPRALDLAAYVAEMIDGVLRSTIPEHIALDLEAEGDDQSPETSGEYVVEVDPARIRQALVNLALNARDAMRDGGRLSFRLSRVQVSPEGSPPVADMPEGDYVRLDVGDTGTGMTDDVVEHLFEPFFTTKEVNEGTGLGLAQVYGIVRQHDGWMDVKTEVGHGSTFTIYLPARKEPASADERGQPADIPCGAGETILLVEDHTALRQAGRTILESLGYRVLEAGNGQDALEVIRAAGKCESFSGIDLVISDLVMPEMNGPELIHVLRHRGVGAPALAITGHSLQEEDKEAVTAAGFSDVIRKPFDATALAKAARHLLDGQREQEVGGVG
jgi:PAS domain S-box-containing protein